MTPKDFLVRFKARAPHLMWFLGAGSSASAGIKTAGQMIVEFKRRQYCLERRVPESRLPDVLDEATKQQIQGVIDQTKRFPIAGSMDEYSAYFEATFPSPADRRGYIQEQIRQGKPSLGHLGLAALLCTNRCPIVWTTNFDPLIEEAYAVVKGHVNPAPDLIAINLNNADEARRIIDSNQHPILVKLHGDYQSVKLMNTTEELKAQDARMRKALVRACGKFGLVVVGYSGRDDSIMDTLEEGLQDRENYAAGIFWIKRSGEATLPRVTSFIEKANANGIEGAIVEVDTFDELVADVLRLETELPVTLNDFLHEMQPPVTDVPLPWPGVGSRLLRLNALLIEQYPATCRLAPVEEGFNGGKQLKDLIDASDNTIDARRSQGGVMAFGSDENIRKTLGSYLSGNLDFQPFHKIASVSGYQSQEHRLIMDALTRAIVRQVPVELNRWHGSPVLLERGDEDPSRYLSLRNVVSGPLTGIVSGYTWREGLELDLEFRASRLWLILNPVVWLEPPHRSEHLDGKPFERLPISDEYAAAREHTRQRRLKRYNKTWNSLLDAWLNVLLEEKEERTFKAFDLQGDGADASFTLKRQTSFSRGIN